MGGILILKNNLKKSRILKHKLTMKTIKSKMKTFKILTLIALFISFTSCDKDKDEPTLIQVESKKVENLPAPQTGGHGQPISGEFTKFSFATGNITTSDTEWDIAFRSTTIIVNGGSSAGLTDEPARNGTAAGYVASGTMASVKEVTTSKFKQDAADGFAIPAGSGNGWYNYTGNPDHLIIPIPGKILVFKTRNGTYAKIEILSWYKDAPATPDRKTNEGRFYTFNYVYQPNEGVTTF
jgi:hypothetical protein